MKKSDKVNWSDENHIREICAISINFSDTCRKLGLHAPSNMRTLKKYITKYSIDISHFDPHVNRNIQFKERIPLDKVLTENSTYHRWHLKRRLIEEGILENICAECGQPPIWNNEPLNMHLDHINGINTDNRICNLRLLCPNCHSQTKTYAGRNKH